MAVQGCSFEEVNNLIKEIQRVRQKIKEDEEYKLSIINHEKNYENIKNFFNNFVSFLRYKESLKIENLYRVRKSDKKEPYSTFKDVIFPPASIHHKDRMNNTSTRVLYTALNEHTAMAETRLDNDYIDKYFQLTRFTTDQDISVFRLGLFSELYLNSPRDSEHTKKKMYSIFGEDGHDLTIRGYAALECALADILYDNSDNYHIITSILADSIFTVNPDIDAIYYPTMQNRYGMNLAISEKLTSTLKVSFTSLNQLQRVHNNGFFEYKTIMTCTDCSNPNEYKFDSVQEASTYR